MVCLRRVKTVDGREHVDGEGYDDVQADNNAKVVECNKEEPCCCRTFDINKNLRNKLPVIHHHEGE